MLEPAQGKKYFFFPFYFLFGHIMNNLITELGRSVWENLDLDRWYRPHCVRSVLATSVKILPYRPPARLIRTKYYSDGVMTVSLSIYGLKNLAIRFRFDIALSRPNVI